MPFYLEPSNEFPQKKENLASPASGLVFSHISDFFLLLTSATPVFKTPLPTQGFVLTVPLPWTLSHPSLNQTASSMSPVGVFT